MLLDIKFDKIQNVIVKREKARHCQYNNCSSNPRTYCMKRNETLWIKFFRLFPLRINHKGVKQKCFLIHILKKFFFLTLFSPVVCLYIKAKCFFIKKNPVFKILDFFSCKRPTFTNANGLKNMVAIMFFFQNAFEKILIYEFVLICINFK